MTHASSADRHREILLQGRWFRGLPPPLVEAMLAAAVVRAAEAGVAILERGEPPSGLCAIVDGSVRVVKRAPDGHERLLMLVGAPSWFGEVELIDGIPTELDVVAEQRATYLHVPLPALDAMLSKEPVWWRDIAKLATGRARLVTVALDDLARASPEVRMARSLLRMTGGYDDWRDRKLRVLSVRQHQLADMVNVSRQKLNQLLGDLAAAGVVRVTYASVEVLDEEALREIARLDT